MSLQTIDWAAVTPALVVAVTAVVVLLADAFLPRRLTGLPTLLALTGLAAAAATAAPLWDERHATFCLVDTPRDCSFVVDRLTLVFWAITIFGTAVVALLGTVALREGRTPLGEWSFLLLSSAAGALALAASRDLISLVVSLEVVSLPAFAMAGMRYGDRRASEAAVKFFLVGVVSTAVMLMGISLLYGVTGSVFFRDISAGVDDVAGSLLDVAVVGALLTIVGLAFKVAAVPFHMWVPDTYVGAPVAVAAYLSVVSKAAGFAGLVLVLTFAVPGLASDWSPVVGALAALTMTVGNVLALRQSHAVRLLAWSSVAQAGYILVPFGAVQGSVGQSVLGASVGYLAIYAFVNLGAFAVATLVGTRHPDQRLDDYRGLVREEPGAGWALAFALVALAGLPPGVVGLVAKVVVFDAAAGPATWLAVVMAVNVAIGLFYYARWLLVLFTPAEDAAATTYDVPTPLALAIGATLTAGVVFSVFPGWVVDNAVAVLG